MKTRFSETEFDEKEWIGRTWHFEKFEYHLWLEKGNIFITLKYLDINQ